MTKWRKFKQDFVGRGGQALEIYCNLCRHHQMYRGKKNLAVIVYLKPTKVFDVLT